MSNTVGIPQEESTAEPTDIIERRKKALLNPEKAKQFVSSFENGEPADTTPK